MTNIIKEDKSVNADNFAFLLAQSNYNLSSVFRSRNHNETVADSPMTGEDGTGEFPPKTDTKSRSHQYQFRILGASTNQIADLKDGVINVVATVYSAKANENLDLDDVPRLGNQALLSLFSSIELYIDSTLIERIDYPGMSSNADFALRYPHSKEAEKVLQSNGFITPLEDTFIYDTHTVTADSKTVVDSIIRVTNGVYDFHNDSVMWSVMESDSDTHYLRGIITQRIRLSDIFPCINTLPPIFNHSVTINFTRQSHNKIIASCQPDQETELSAFLDFKIVQDCYIITDELKKAAMAYYSKPIETIFTKCKQINKGLEGSVQEGSTLNLNISVDSAYKNKLAVICIPRASHLDKQPKTITTKLTKESYEDSDGKHYDTAHAPANSYTHGGLSSLNVYTMNGVKLYGFNMARDGNVKGIIDTYNKLAMMDFNLDPTKTGNGADIYNYQDVYEQYLKAREQFGQIPEEGLDYITFLKEYCIYCVDLSPFTISPGENLRIELTFAHWADDYNPYYENNSSSTGSPKLSTNILTLFYSDKILRLLPNQNVELADLFQARTEADETNEL